MTDLQKFKCLTVKYRDIYKDYERFAKRSGIGRSTVHNWEKGIGKGTINSANRAKICTVFGLEYDVWTEDFNTEHAFFKQLDQFRLKDIDAVDSIVIGDIAQMSDSEEKQIRALASEATIAIPANLEQYSYEFMFALAKLLKQKNQIRDAMRVLDVVMENEQFAYTYYGQLHHLRAVLLSHRDIQQWDEALKELRFLYKVVAYHLQEREVITLMASNLKRKALYHPNGTLNHPDQIECDMLGNALALYTEAYTFKEEEHRYYDAINMAYLIAILDAVCDSDEPEEEPVDVKAEISAIYASLKPKENGDRDWKANCSDWWQVATKMEFLVLLGRADDAARVYDDYSFEHTPESFDLDAIIRQLEAYTHFVDDSEAEAFLAFLKSEFENLA